MKLSSFYLNYNINKGFFISDKVLLLQRRVEQLVARRAHNPKVAGSSPAPASRKKPLIFSDKAAFLMS
jgi:hypothetical protein